MLFEISDKAEKEISKYSDDYEIYLELEKVLQLDAQKNNLSFAKEEINMGIGIRVISEEKLGFAYSSDVSKIKDVAEKAYLNSKLNEPDENFCFADKTKLKTVKNIYDPEFENLDVEKASSFLESTIATCIEEGCEPTSGGFSASLENNLIINSNGVSAFNEYTDFSAFIAINAEKDGQKSTAYDSTSSCIFKIDGEKLAKETCQVAKDSIGGVSIETKDTEVILDYRGAVGLLSTFVNAFNADNVQRGRSILKDKINTSIISKNISIYDDGSLESGLNSSKSDDEGVGSGKTCLVEEGVLKSFIYDTYTAKKQNSDEESEDNIKSTSNGFRGSYAGTPSVSPSNIIFDFKEKVDISEIENGFIATDVLGAHTANPISGDFSVEANNAFLIENGEISKPVKKAMISGNIFQALSDCKGVKSEIKQYGPFLIPKIMFNNLRVVG
ncbi:Metalloprotease TldD [bioreactor metagenome]|uniref:Metalloprotease TldD n=1 Tax=bioreactor metagenome TaxID=1076179 RepID=A0A644SU05_9ZZZZ|nr:TldD/PmbA family protein [Methanobrevibacter sp.]MEA4956235.1 TldD/PmbA family protein [Methanobrevibacter sp.]